MLFAYCTICNNIILTSIRYYSKHKPKQNFVILCTNFVNYMNEQHALQMQSESFPINNFKGNAIIVFTDIRKINNILNLPCWRMQSYSKYIVILLGLTKIRFVDLLSFSWFRELSWNIFRLIKNKANESRLKKIDYSLPKDWSNPLLYRK